MPAGAQGRLTMDLALTESQEMLRTSARSFVEREAPTHTIVALQRETSSLVPALWRKAVDVGWPGILVPAEYGGSESTLTDAAVLFEELGRGPVPGPFWSSGVLGALIVLEAASAQQRTAILPAVARGEIILSVAITDPNTSWGPQAVTLRPQRLGDRFRLDGTKLFVSDATAATHLIVAVRTGDGPADVSLLMVDARARGGRARRLPGFLSWQEEVKLDTGRPAAEAVHLAKAVASEGYLEACNAAHEVHAGQGSLTEYGLAAHTQMSRTLFAYLGDPRWHKRRMADALGW